MAQTKRSQSPKNRSSGCLIWLIPIVLGLVVLLANPKVMSDLRTFLTASGKNRTNVEASPDPRLPNPDTSVADADAKKTDAKKTDADAIRPLPDTSDLRAVISQDMREQEKKLRELLEKEQQDIANQQTAANQPSAANQGVAAPSVTGESSFSVRIFFVYYDTANDLFLLKPVTRVLKRDDTPAFTTLQALFAGPTAEELRAGYRTLLPKNLQVRRMHVENGILVIDLSREFLYNQTSGREGLILQIYQIVNSMTDFKTVQAVRFLIEGERHAGLGGDGVPFDRAFIHTERPLTR